MSAGVVMTPRAPGGPLCVRVAPGDPLPQRGGNVVVESPSPGLAYRVTVKSIKAVEWEYARFRRDEIVAVRVWVTGPREVIERHGGDNGD